MTSDSVDKDVGILVPLLRTKTKRRLWSRAGYDVLAGALFWPDEVPDELDDNAIGAFRRLLRYRTTLFLGAPDQELEALWEATRNACPDWVGFSKSRCRASRWKRMRYLVESDQARLWLDDEDLDDSEGGLAIHEAKD